MTALLDSNVLIAVAVTDHVHHEQAEAWFAASEQPFATCPITQGALFRLVIRHGATAEQAARVLAGITSRHAHQFWPDDLSYGEVAMTGVIGHQQVTDAYLAGLARHRAAQLATFDNGVAALHPTSRCCSRSVQRTQLDRHAARLRRIADHSSRPRIAPVSEVAEHIVCVDCGGRCHRLSYPPDEGFQPGDVVAYRCEDCRDRWDVVVGEPED